MSKFNTALEAGEKLYASTSTDGREVIRQELRDLRQSWESLCDGVTENDRHLDMALSQWTAFQDRLQQLQAWMNDTQSNLTDVELKNNLQQKKAMLQHYRVYLSVKLSTDTHLNMTEI